MDTAEFQELIWEKGRELYRDMPWRQDTNPYYVLVSEIMLQQTQVDRVRVKFHEFMALFPDINALSSASLAAVLTSWSGLGYNRRAKFLHEAARMIVDEFGGTFPDTKQELVKLPGVGVNTAGAILTYSFNQPVVFIETNIRTVYFHHFYQDQQMISDKELAAVVADTIDREHPREWYWALMDYGSYLKKNGIGLLDKSTHYKKQTPLKGSVREVRGLILKALTVRDMEMSELQRAMPDDERFDVALQGLTKDGLVTRSGQRLHLTQG